jgi:dTDP-4-dehydrorhamnose 3,5-epimerase
MINGLTFGELTVGVDPRGVVREFFRQSRAAESGIPAPKEGWAQINVTESNYGAVRGLHAEATDKLIGIVTGEGFGVWIDARPTSDSFGEMMTSFLHAGTRVYVPAGVLNGWQSLAQPSQYIYCFSSEWTPDLKGVWVNPLDATLSIPWPVPIEKGNRVQISAKDESAASWDATRKSLSN